VLDNESGSLLQEIFQLGPVRVRQRPGQIAA
jgi:hypothetical protein